MSSCPVLPSNTKTVNTKSVPLVLAKLNADFAKRIPEIAA
jgi:hypothetical protein